MKGKTKGSPLTKFLHNNALLIAMFSLFILTFIGLSFTGLNEYNSEQGSHKEKLVTYSQYLTTSHFQEAIFENWESEFLQMWSLVVLSIFLRQKGSPESKKLTGKDDVDEEPNSRHGILTSLYSNSLSFGLLFLFAISFIIHGIAGHLLYNSEQISHGQSPISLLDYFFSSEFWFQSFQNWQSEFLSVGVLILFTIFLRQKGSPESKPVNESNEKTGK